jgi:ribonuclease Z
LEIYTFPLNHRIPTTGFLFKEKPKKRKLNSTEINRYQVPISYFEYLQKGADWQMPDGFLVENSKLTIAPPPPRSYAFVSDTRYLPELADFLKGTDLIYHEATFMQDMLERATQTLHSTSEEAATFAQKAGAHHLILGHFSARYLDLNPLLLEAKAIFPNSELAKEGTTFSIGRPE